MTAHYWVVIPAAGSGIRMGSKLPKQYHKIGQQTVIEQTLNVFLRRTDIAGIIVAIAADDVLWSTLPVSCNPLIRRTEGGGNRQQSVLNGLNLLHTMAHPDDWVLVHDAARPCIHKQDIDKLIHHTITSNATGGILALPVRDTLKRADSQGHIAETIDRTCMWHALTPQMFRLGILLDALYMSIKNKCPVTDEAMAMEKYGHQPLLVKGYSTNIKITRPEDLLLATLYLEKKCV